MKKPNEKLKESLEKILGPDKSGGDRLTCRKCGKKFTKQVDPYTKKLSDHLFRCETPGCMSSRLRLNIG